MYPVGELAVAEDVGFGLEKYFGNDQVSVVERGIVEVNENVMIG